MIDLDEAVVETPLRIAEIAEQVRVDHSREWQRRLAECRGRVRRPARFRHRRATRHHRSNRLGQP